MEILLYDAEIKNAILGAKESPLPGITYAKSFKDFEGMGISVVGTYSYITQKYELFEEDELKELQELMDSHKLLVGFNNLNFDNKLLSCNGIHIPREKVYDIYLEVKHAAGAGTFAKGYRLQDIALANGLEGKSGNGKDAPIMWQRGLLDDVRAYCHQDMVVTKEVFDLIIAGILVSPVTHNVLHVMKPVEEVKK